MYDPNVGRWLSEDPIGFEAGDANVYRYVGNASTLFVDPSGFVPTDLAPGGPTQFAPIGVANKDIQDNQVRKERDAFRRRHGGSPVADKIADEIDAAKKPPGKLGRYLETEMWREVDRRIVVVSSVSGEYNCLGAVLLLEEYIRPNSKYRFRLSEVTGWVVDRLKERGFKEVGLDDKEKWDVKTLKVAIYEEDDEFVHIAIQDGNGNWLSKMGASQLIRHPDLECIIKDMGAKERKNWKVTRIFVIGRDKWLKMKPMPLPAP